MKKFIPEDKNQAIVATPYGRGLVIRSGRKDGVQEIRLMEWKMASSSRSRRSSFPMLYSKQKYPSVKPSKGDDISCTWGRGKVLEVREDGIVVVQLVSWRLANRSLVRCYLNSSDVQVVRKKLLSEMSVYERIEYAKECKLTATNKFSRKLYDEALISYSKAVDAIRYVQHDNNSSNEIRADLVVIMITCCNNAATCCKQLKNWNECIKFANNALVLLDALYGKRGLRIHTILNSDGYGDQKLFGEWRIKSYLLAARAHFEKQEFEKVSIALDTASKIIVKEIVETPVLLSQQKEIKALKAHCIREQKALKKKEKKRAQAMFGSGRPSKKPAQPSGNNSKDTLKTKVSRNINHEEKEPTVSPISERLASLQPTEENSISKIKSHTTIENEEEEEEIPWYEEHMEAFIVTGVLGIIGAGAFLTSALLRNKR